MTREKEILMRSLLFVPGHIDKYMHSALTSKADVLLPDVEDSVPTEADKKTAVKNIVQFAESGKFKNLQVFPRVDLDFNYPVLNKLAIPGITGFMIPKVKNAFDVREMNARLSVIERNTNVRYGTYKLIPLIETAAAVLHAEEISRASERVIALAFGSEDYLSEITGLGVRDETSFATARAWISIAAKAAGILAIDTVNTNVFDIEVLNKKCKEARCLGYDGSLILHPVEIEHVHRWFSPSEEEMELARDIIKKSEEAKKKGKGVAIINNRFVGPPMVASAKNMIEKHKLIQKNKRQ